MRSFLVIFLIFLGLFFLGTGAGLVTDYFWFESLGLESVFLTQIYYKAILFAGVFVFFTGVLYGNLKFSIFLTRFFSLPFFYYQDFNANQKIFHITKNFLNIFSLATSAFIGYVAANFAKENWDVIVKFLHSSEFQIQDPIFGEDLSFYFFTLPFWNSILGWLQILVLICLATSILFYLIRIGTDRWSGGLQSIFTGPVRFQISFLLFALSFLLAFDFYLRRYELLWSSGGVVYGAGFTDLHTRLYSYWFMAFFTFLLGFVLIVNLFLKHTGVLTLVVGAFLAVSVLTQGVLPALVQKFVVEPNEFAKERPYLEYNIQYTRMAYGLDSVSVQDYPGTGNLDANKITKNQQTIRNIRLWDWEPLLSTYRQLQEIRLYYRFNDVDVDRYTVDGVYRQMMLSVREFDYNQVPERAQTWVNQRLRYTHGYGLVASPVNQVTEEGLPTLFVKDIPPTKVRGMEIDRPEIYYGELTNDYIFTNTKSPEFDYPLGDSNQDTFYEGTGGIHLDSLWKRLLYAIAFRNFRIQISEYFTNESRVHYYRNIRERVEKIAPFLQYDRDPYPAIVNGRIYWIIDAYIMDRFFPYSEHFDRNGNNYIRNSVKAIIDAYNGSVQFAIIDENEPLTNTYRKIFPNLFVSFDSLEPELINHFRYPVDLFKIQAKMYLAYHMTDPTVFYNREDMWRFPVEKVGDLQKPVEPYYMIIRLPGQEKEEFMLILPFTPVNKSNMVGWMAVGCDPKSYGKSIVYKFPKQELLYGPMQIESRIDQNPEISEQITLWSQQGSRVQRGNLLVIPIEESILYVEPLYLQAKTGQMPELKRVIVAYKNDIVMEPTLESALRRLFRGLPYTEGTKKPIESSFPTGSETGLEKASKLGNLATELLQKSDQALRSGNWKEYGEFQNELKQVILELNRTIQTSLQKKPE